MNNKRYQGQLGQIVLMVMLASVLVLTVGLSFSRRTVVETRIDSDEELLKQAFNTAESGVEYYLATGEVDYSGGNGTAEVDVSSIGDSTTLESDGVALVNNPFLFWLVDHDEDRNVSSTRFNGTINEICADEDFDGALKVDLFTYNGSYSVQRYGFNFGGSGTVNGFTDISGSNCTNSINVTEGMLLVVTPVGVSTGITVNGDVNFPVQGEEITSVGESESGVNTKVKIINRFEVPLFMLEAVTAGNSVLSQ